MSQVDVLGSIVPASEATESADADPASRGEIKNFGEVSLGYSSKRPARRLAGACSAAIGPVSRAARWE